MPRLATATITRARRPAEAALLRDSLEQLSDHGIPVCVADGGSGEAFLDRLRALPHLMVTAVEPGDGPRLLGQVQAALAAAGSLEPEFVLYTEPDKGWFFAHRLRAFLEALQRHPEAGVLVAARDGASFATFPAGQQLTERLTNALCAEVLGQAGDFLYGPLLLRASLLPHLGRVREDVGWGWRLLALVLARRLALPVVCHTADLPCPEGQRGEDDLRSRTYRMEQMAQNVRGLVLGLRMPLDE